MVMGISVDELAATYPKLYHVTSEGSWQGIQRHGLLSTKALLDLFGIDGEFANGFSPDTGQTACR